MKYYIDKSKCTEETFLRCKQYLAKYIIKIYKTAKGNWIMKLRKEAYDFRNI